MPDDPRFSAKAAGGFSAGVVPIGVIPITGLPEIVQGDDLGRMIAERCVANGTPIAGGDLVVVAQKVVSKAEGAVQRISAQVPSDEALRLAERVGKDPRLVQIVLDQSSRVVRAVTGVLIVETRHGFICANAGIDQSNVEGDDLVTTLPDDPDASARAIRDAILESGVGPGRPDLPEASGPSDRPGRPGRRIGVLVSDTFNRPWREGSINVAIGTAGFDPLHDLRGSPDDFERAMTTSVVSLADEVASMAQLVTGESGRVPVAIVRGVDWEPGEFPVSRLLRPPGKDLFR